MNERLLLELHGVSKLSLRDVNLRLSIGERVAVLGESGAGKSVLLSLILGLSTPDSGQVLRPGVNHGSLRGFYDEVGVAFQQPGLFDALSISGNIAIGNSEGGDRTKVVQLLRAMNLDTVSLEGPVSNLSGGQQKRVSLARAILHSSQLLILDEPTSGLDSRSTSLVGKLLKDTLSSRSMGLFMITHDYRLAYQVCDRILLITNGTLKDVTPVAGLSEEESIGYLEDSLSSSSRALPVSGRKKKVLGWSYFRYVRQFLPAGLMISVPVMALLSVMLVVESRGISPIDISRYVPGAVTVALFRELVPLLVGLLLVSRVGGAIAAEISGMSYSSQLDSMRVMKLSLLKFLLRPIGLASITVFPSAYLAAGAISVYVASLTASFPWSGLTIGSDRFLYLAMQALTPSLIVSCLLKGIVSGFGVALLSFLVTARVIRTASILGVFVTRAIVISSVFVVLTDIAFSWIFFSGGRV